MYRKSLLFLLLLLLSPCKHKRKRRWHRFRNIGFGFPSVKYVGKGEFGEYTVTKVLEKLPEEVANQIEIQVKYQGYIERQFEEAKKLKKQANTKLPQNFDYRQVYGLSAELAEKLNKIQPTDIAQAQRIQAMTPAAISVLLIHLAKMKNEL